MHYLYASLGGYGVTVGRGTLDMVELLSRNFIKKLYMMVFGDFNQINPPPPLQLIACTP